MSFASKIYLLNIEYTKPESTIIYDSSKNPISLAISVPLNMNSISIADKSCLLSLIFTGKTHLEITFIFNNL